jgi:hypothetical protein
MDKLDKLYKLDNLDNLDNFKNNLYGRHDISLPQSVRGKPRTLKAVASHRTPN